MNQNGWKIPLFASLAGVVIWLWVALVWGTPAPTEAKEAKRPKAPALSARRVAKVPGPTQIAPELRPLPPRQRKVLWSSAHGKPRTRRRHYYKTNESRHDLFRPYLRGLRGGYIGVASSQNYNMIAWARSEFAWLIDFDDGIQDIHWIHRAFILQSKTSQAFLRRWSQQQEGIALLRKVYRAHPSRERIVRIFKRFHRRMHRHLLSRYRGAQGRRYPTWLNQPASYRYIRRMYQTDRIRIVFGNLLGKVTLRGIAKAARAAKMPVRVVYLSNAEEWFTYRKSFRRNMLALSFDRRSVIIRTFWEKNFQPRASDNWQYNVHRAQHFQTMLQQKSVRSIYSLNPWMTLANEWGLTLIDLPVR